MAAQIKAPVNMSQANIRKPQLINKIEGHSDDVNMAIITPQEEGVITASDDRTVRVWLKRDTGQYWPSICHTMQCAASCIDFNAETRKLFVGLENGTICEYQVADDYNKMNHVRDYLGSVRSLAWDDERSLLFSASFDQSIIVWDIGGRQGTAFELQGHHDRVQSVVYASSSKQLLSAGDDCILAIWDMDVKRQETPDWAESDMCQKCNSPFFWNVKTMWEMKTIGVRQHHCRHCGKAICAKCSQNKSTIPVMGYEYEVRVCDQCHSDLSDEDRAPMATFHDTKQSVTFMSLDSTRKQLLTVGKDRVIKVAANSVVCPKCDQAPRLKSDSLLVLSS
ncbi:hypothetical protein LSH36_1134g00024 [Paralvinella palmiformis]|uniref:FYVE-type domain-containing protein n=1 Tax=Paralvinella palmiformis TaxID=53620 RepID=A0AAD9MPJ1_9ANNE|nr:hypothetical protein LSH36_1134g00024 [Paralvinella palmiformis]